MTESDLTPRRRRLPDASLVPLARDGDAVPLRAHRRATVLVLLDERTDERDVAYLRELAKAEMSLRGWDGRVLVVVAGDGAALRALLLDAPPPLPFPVLADPQGTLAAAAGVAPPALVVTDQYGEVYAAHEAGPTREWLAVTEIEGWLRYLSIRCAG